MHETPDRLPGSVRQVAIFCESTDTLRKADNDEFFVCLVREGMARVRIDDVETLLCAPAVLCLNERQTAETLQPHSLAVRSIYFDPTFLNRNMTKETIRSSDYAALADRHDYFLLSPFLKNENGGGLFPDPEPDAFARLDMLFRQCEAETQAQPDWYWSCRARSYFIELLLILERMVFDRGGQSGGSRPQPAYSVPSGCEDIGAVMNFLGLHYAEALTLSDIAARFHRSRSGLSRRFKMVTGQTLFDYLTEYRLQVAASMLRFTSLSVEEISARVGFAYATNFIVTFKNRFGATPNRFRSRAVALRKKQPFSGQKV